MANATLVFKHSFRGETGTHRCENLISTATCLTEVIAVSILSNQQGSVILGEGNVGMWLFMLHFFQCSNKHFHLGYGVDITCLVF